MTAFRHKLISSVFFCVWAPFLLSLVLWGLCQFPLSLSKPICSNPVASLVALPGLPCRFPCWFPYRPVGSLVVFFLAELALASFLLSASKCTADRLTHTWKEPARKLVIFPRPTFVAERCLAKWQGQLASQSVLARKSHGLLKNATAAVDINTMASSATFNIK